MCPQLDYALEAPPETTDNRLIISADQGVLEKDGLSSLAGAVKLQQAGKQFSAQALDYDDKQRQVHVRMESLFRNRELIVKSREADFDLNSETGIFSGTEFTLPQRAARGDAGKITLSKTGTAEFDEVRYTTCSPGSRAWFLEAREITLNHKEGLGSARNARLRFHGVPILYMPYFQFPIDNRRRTGLLFPTVGQSTKTGFDFRWPLYVNLAPNYDATLTPRYMSRRGLQLGSQTRYLLEQSEGRARYDFLSNDQVTGEQRSYFDFQHRGLINKRLSLDAHFANASDRGYLEDLGGEFDTAAITHLDRSARLTYQAPAAYSIQALAQDYQTVSSNVLPQDEPYRRLPQILVKARTKNSIQDTRLGLTGEYANFVRTGSVQGQRVNFQPYLLMEKERNTWFFSSEANLDYTYYQLSGSVSGKPNRPARTLPQYSAEGGVRFERLTAGGDLQTLEPRLFYLYTPFREQSALPVFDSGEPDFDFTQLFARNRFSGEDRVSDANQLAVAATSRLLDPASGREKLSASVGQLFRFTAPRVQLPGALNVPERGATDFIASLDYRLSQTWSSGFTSQWSPDQKRFNRSSLALHYHDYGRRLDLAYRYRQNILEQADITASAPVGGSWRLAGRFRYSLRDNTSLDNMLGVEYSTCCWSIRSSYRRYIANTRGELNSGLYLQLELKGLTRIGSGFDSLLPLDEPSKTGAY